MAKIFGLFGSMTGKVADIVMSVRNGEQIARKYQPIVFNPSTRAQVAQRAKLKLLSQLSAVMGPVIAMPRRGSVSSRNLFTKINFPATIFENNEAKIPPSAIKLTQSVVSLPAPYVAFGENALSVSISDSSSVDVTRVVYVAVRRMNDDTMRLAGSTVVDTPGPTNNFVGTIPVETVDATYFVYVYGVRDNNENARVIFGNMTVTSAPAVAKLIVNRTLTENDVTLTETKFAMVAPNA